MNKRIFVEKKSNFNIKAQALVKELKHNLQLTSLTDLRIIQVYDVFGLADSLFERAEKHIFSEQVTDTILAESDVVAELANYAFFAIESLPGQFDQRAASSQEALLLLGSSNDVTVNTAQLYLVNKDINTAELDAVKNYLLNPVDSRLKILRQELHRKHFQSRTKRFQILISSRLIQQLNLLIITLSKVWQWKWMTLSSSKIISKPSGACQRKQN